MKKYSVIIPTLNEETFIEKTICHLISFDEDFDIIIVDGESKDDTVKIAKQFDVKIVNSRKGRGYQQNKGASIAEGEILVFLHADTFLPAKAFNLINKYFNDPNVKIANFKLRIDMDSFVLRISEWFTKFDLYFSNFGDQTIVIRRNFFFELGQFAELPMFEDVELFKKARKLTTIFKMPDEVITSARRFKQYGVTGTQLLNAWYLLLYFLGKDPGIIYKKYYL